jgi:hypothetical protein
MLFGNLEIFCPKLQFQFHVHYFETLYLSNQAETDLVPIDKVVDLTFLYNFANYTSRCYEPD